VLRTLALSGVAAVVIAADWLRFEEPRSDGGRPFALAALAIAPALLRPLWLRAAAALASAFAAAWIAFSVSPLALWPGGDGFFGPLATRFERGFLDFYEFRLPIDPAQHERMHQTILAAVFAFTLAVALAIAARRVVFAVLAFLVGAGWPATLLAGGNELGRGAFILGVTLLLLAGLPHRPNRLAVGASAAVLAGALALSSSPAVAKNGFLDWQHWDFYTRAQAPVSVRYVWDAQYSGIHFPKTRTTVLTIRAPGGPYYWRATVLDRFDGTRWVEHVWRETPAEARVLTPAGAHRPSNWIEQDVTVKALRDDHLIGASVPVAQRGGAPVRYEGQGVARVVGGLERDQHYTVWSYSSPPTPTALVRVRPVYPAALTRPGRELDVGPVTAPTFGVPNRDARLLRMLTGRLEPYAEMYERALSVAGQTRSPYAASIALEAWFRSTGGFVYSEKPGSAPGLPPLVGFVVDTKTGYCQHFAGAMAVMLRLLGIPARVAAGFVAGHFHDGRWTVTDHDAHTWVEVWFPRYGWLPFDPTPGRGRLGGTYSSTSPAFDAGAAARLLAKVVTGGEVFGRGAASGIIAHDPNRRTPRSAGDRPLTGGGPLEESAPRQPSLLWFLFLLAAGAATVVVVLKHGRRRLRYLTRDPRRIAGACARELSEFLQDQRFVLPRAPTPQELGAAVSDSLGVDADAFARATTAARYGPPSEARAAATAARVELRELKRRLRRGLRVRERARGLLSVRSLGLG
jgi:transglutaminase-like putative cysteine protease